MQHYSCWLVMEDWVNNILCLKFGLQELIPTRQEGEARICQVRSLGDKTLPQTAPSGQQQIRRELDALTHDWDLYSTKLTETLAGLEATKESWEEFDTLYETLSKWLRDMEIQLKDQELKSTLADKRGQVERFKVSL